MLKSLAVIRGTSIRECPFGLGLTNLSPCKLAGDSVDQMQALAEVPASKRSACQAANRKIFRHYASETPCKYADSVMEAKNVVNCDHGDFGAGIKDVALPASPIYPSLFTGSWSTGLFAYPINFYNDNYESRQIFSAIHSIYSHTGEIRINNNVIEPDPVLMELVKI